MKITADLLKQTFHQMFEDEARGEPGAAAYYPHIARLYRDAEALPTKCLERMAALLNEKASPGP